MDKREKLYERALATCVVMLIACIILKLFGVQWFDCNKRDQFKKICDVTVFIDRVYIYNKNVYQNGRVIHSV